MYLLNLILTTSLAVIGYQQGQAPAKYSVGDVIELSGARLTVKVGSAERFPNVKVAGAPFVVEMQFTSRESILLWFRPGPKPSSSDLTLLVGDQTLAPVAMTEDRPSPAGAKEPVLMNELRLAPGTGKSFIGWSFEGAQGVWWLFDVPLESDRAPRTASLKFDVGNQPQALLVKLR